MTDIIMICALAISLTANIFAMNTIQDLQGELLQCNQFQRSYAFIINSMEGGRHTLYAPAPVRKP